MTSFNQEEIPITPIDHVIISHGGTTENYERLRHRLNLSKPQSPPPRSQRLEELTRENSRIRMELDHSQQVCRSLWVLYNTAIEANNILREGISVAARNISDADDQLKSFWGIP